MEGVVASKEGRMIPIDHLTEQDFYERGKNVNSDHFLTEVDRKIKFASDRRASLDPEDIEDPKDFDDIRAQYAQVKLLQQQQGAAGGTAAGLTRGQEQAIDALLSINSVVMDKVDLGIRMKLVTGAGYERGQAPGRSVPGWERIGGARLSQLKLDQARLRGAGLKARDIQDYEQALNNLMQKDREQESRRPEPTGVTRELAIAKGKLSYMIVWLCGIAEQAFRDKPESRRGLHPSRRDRRGYSRTRALTPRTAQVPPGREL
jgi:hypothetical protein